MDKRPAARAINYLLAQQWAILPDHLARMQAIAARAERGDALAIMTQAGQPLAETRAVVVRDGVAVVPVIGPLFRYANLFTDISGATSLESLAFDFSRTADDPTVREIVLHVDTPGGMVSGISEFAQMVRSTKKPVTAFVSDLGASGGYWVASAAARVVVADTARLGSIGVVTSFGPPADDGSIEIVSSQSPLKRATPDTDAGLAEIQREVDELAQVFIAAVAAHRGLSVDRVMSDFGRGGVLLGAAAVRAGMADAVGTLEQLIQDLAGGGSAGPRRAGTVPVQRTQAAGAAAGTQRGSAMEITVEIIKRDFPAVAEALCAEGRTAAEQAAIAQVAQARSEAATAERERIRGVQGQLLPGHEALIAELGWDGKTTPEQAAVRVLQAQRAKQAQVVGAVAADAAAMPAIVGTPSATGEGASIGVASGAPVEERCQAKWDSDPAVRAEFVDLKSYTAFVRAEEAGRVRMLGGARK